MAAELVIKSEIASAMGAKISVTGPVRGIYLIIGNGMLQDSPVKGAGGEVVLRLNGNKMLATLPFAGYLSLRGSCRVRHIGPVSVDIKRLTKVAEMLSKTVSPKSNGNP